MTSTHITPARLCLAAGVALLTTLTVSATASAVEFAPKAVVTATSGCEGDTFYLHTNMSNVGNVSAHFVVTAVDVFGPITVDVGTDVAPGGSQVNDWKFFEGVTGSVHITSNDNSPAVDYYFEVTPDCVPEVTTTVAEETTTTVVEVRIPTDLPVTGSSSSSTGVLAFGLLGIGILMLRFTRRTS